MSTRYVPNPPIDDPWQGGLKSDFSPQIFQWSLNPPFFQKFWRHNYDDSAFWVGTPNERIPVLDDIPGGNFPIKPPYWKYNNDDPGFWVGAETVPIFTPHLQGREITTTRDIQLPINCVLMGDQLYERQDFYEGVPPGHGGLRIVQGMWGKKN